MTPKKPQRGVQFWHGNWLIWRSPLARPFPGPVQYYLFTAWPKYYVTLHQSRVDRCWFLPVLSASVAWQYGFVDVFLGAFVFMYPQFFWFGSYGVYLLAAHWFLTFSDFARSFRLQRLQSNLEPGSPNRPFFLSFGLIASSCWGLDPCEHLGIIAITCEYWP